MPTTGLSMTQIAQAAYQAGFRGQGLQWMTAIAMRESGGRPDAYNPIVVPPYGNASGVYQILTPGIWEAWSKRCGYGGASPFDAKANVSVAAWTVGRYGWSPWTLDGPYCGF